MTVTPNVYEILILKCLSSVSLLHAPALIFESQFNLRRLSAFRCLSSRIGRLESMLARAKRLPAVTRALLNEVIASACDRLRTHGRPTKAAFNQLVACGTWTDAVLQLLQLELPQWKLRRINYEDGEWHCFLSKQRQVPLGFDADAEAAHEVLPLAILLAFIRREAQLRRR